MKSKMAIARRRYKLKRKFGITIDEYNEMVEAQNGRCAICGCAVEVLVIDHDHRTGTVRALLCNGCNVGIGYFKENVDIMLAAISYLRFHKKCGTI